MKNYAIATVIILASVLIVLFAASTKLFVIWENKTVDSRMRYRYRIYGPEVEQRIRLIGIDDQSLQALSARWPINWKWHALLMQALASTPPAVVPYDILFDAADGEDPTGRDNLVAATTLLGDVVYPYYLVATGHGKRFKSAETQRRERGVLDSYRIGHINGDIGSLPSANDFILPIPGLADAAALGFANMAEGEPDETVRRMPLLMRLNGNVFPSFTLMTVLRFYNVAAGDVTARPGNAVSFTTHAGKEIVIPIDKRGVMYINYTGAQNDFPNNIFIQVLQSFSIKESGRKPPVDLSSFEGAIVLVGLTASGVIESYPKVTPLSPDCPLLTIHANAVNTILTGRFPRPLGYGTALFLLVIIGIAVALTTGFLRASPALLLTVLLLVLFGASSYLLYNRTLVIVPLLPGLLTGVLVYILQTSYRFASEERQRRYYRGVLGKYLSRNVMELLLRNPTALKLGGERREMTVLFADIRGFSTFCERNPVDVIAPRLNEIHDCLTRVIWQYDGTLDKYMGDGLMAFWGAPLEQPDHARRAVLAAVEMRRALARLRDRWLSQGQEPLSVGIGINTGAVIVGNMGATDFWDYTVLGDEVNLAARLQELTRNYDTDVLLSESTGARVKEIVKIEKLGVVRVRGRETPSLIYKLP